MATTINLLTAVRLTGRITTNPDETLEIVSLLDKNQAITALDVGAEHLPVRVEIHDFEQDGTSWSFPEGRGWTRGSGNYAWAEFSQYGDTEKDNSEILEFTAVGTAEGAAAREKSTQIYIKIKPIAQGPDDS